MEMRNKHASMIRRMPGILFALVNLPWINSLGLLVQQIPAEFTVTDFLKAGENKMAIEAND